MSNKHLFLALALIAAVGRPGMALSKSHHATRIPAHHGRATSGSDRTARRGSARLQGATVYVGKDAVLTVYGTSRHDAGQRAASVQQRIDQALKWGIPESKVSLRKVGKVLTVTWGGHVVATVDMLQSQGSRMKPWALGNTWVGAIQRTMARQTFGVGEKTFTVAVGQAHTLALTGAMSGVTTATVDSPIVTTQIDDATHQMTVHALKAGDATMHVHRGHSDVAVKVMVRDLAGALPSELHCVVTGDPAPKAVVNDALMYAIKGGVHLTPGAKIYLRGEPPLPENLLAGQETTLSIPLSLEGPELLPVKRLVRLTIKNRPTLLSDAALLMVSNRPENLDGNGVVFTGKFGPGRPARLLYSHTNGGSQPRQVCVTLTNRSDKPAEVFMVGVAGTPQVNPALAASDTEGTFLSRSAQGSGVVLTIPPRTAWQVLQQSVPSQQHVVGLAHFESLSGEDVEITVQARENGVPLMVASRSTLAEGASAGHPKGTFASPNLQVQATYKAGDVAQNVPIGTGSTLVDTASGESDTDNLGALYHMTLKLSNPSDQTHRVDLAWVAGDQPGRACFWLGSKIQDTTLVPANTEAPLETIELGPNDTRTVELTTLRVPGAVSAGQVSLRTETEPAVSSTVAPTVVPTAASAAPSVAPVVVLPARRDTTTPLIALPPAADQVAPAASSSRPGEASREP